MLVNISAKFKMLTKTYAKPIFLQASGLVKQSERWQQHDAQSTQSHLAMDEKKKKCKCDQEESKVNLVTLINKTLCFVSLISKVLAKSLSSIENGD